MRHHAGLLTQCLLLAAALVAFAAFPGAITACCYATGMLCTGLLAYLEALKLLTDTEL